MKKVVWPPNDKALQKITFPHINKMIEPIVKNQDKTWGGTLLQFKENNQWKTKVLEVFYTF